MESTYSGLIPMFGLAFTIFSSMAVAVWVIRAADKREVRHEMEQMAKRLSHEVDTLRQEIDGCDKAKVESLRNLAEDMRGQLEKKVETPVFETAITFIKEAVASIKADNALALSDISRKVDELKGQ